jgi:hypothetical protein
MTGASYDDEDADYDFETILDGTNLHGWKMCGWGYCGIQRRSF